MNIHTDSAILGFVIGALVTFFVVKKQKKRKDISVSSKMFEESKIYLRNAWFLGALKRLHIADYVNSNPEVLYYIGVSSFKLEDYEEATRSFWNTTCYYLRGKDKFKNDFYWSEFFCDSYFMWALSDAMQGGDVGWSNCAKYCTFAINDIEKGYLPHTVNGKNSPLVCRGDYDSAFRVLRIFSSLISEESTDEFLEFDFSTLKSRFSHDPYSNKFINNMITSFDENTFSPSMALRLWKSDIYPSIISDKS